MDCRETELGPIRLLEAPRLVTHSEFIALARKCLTLFSIIGVKQWLVRLKGVEESRLLSKELK